jgi:hypothetical protein
MTLIAAVGQAQAFDGREAGLQAAHRALNQLGANTATFAVVVFSYQYDAAQVSNGVASLLGNTPLLGFSTSATLSAEGQAQQSVVVALLSGEDLQAETHWFSNYAQSSEDAAGRLQQLLEYQQRPAQAILVFADGFNGDAEQFINALPERVPVMGGLSAGDTYNALAYQIAGTQSGANSLAAAFLRGRFRLGLGFAHGWQPVGPRARVTRARGFWLRTLDGRPASETYARLFGYPAREWAQAPLNAMPRLYPFGIDVGGGSEDLLLRSPLRVEADGSLRMNVQVRDGSDLSLLLGVPSACQQAAREAARQAMESLGKARPVLALVLVDTAWQMLLQAEPGAELAALRQVLGPGLPVIGGYTLGQIVPPGRLAGGSRFLNQHMLVILFGEAAE